MQRFKGKRFPLKRSDNNLMKMIMSFCLLSLSEKQFFSSVHIFFEKITKFFCPLSLSGKQFFSSMQIFFELNDEVLFARFLFL